MTVAPLARASSAAACDEVGAWLVPCRRCCDEVHPEPRGDAHERVAHVVAVADVGDAEPGQLAEAFSQGHGVGESLERMGVVGQAVDDGDRRMLGELLDLRLVVGADHQG